MARRAMITTWSSGLADAHMDEGILVQLGVLIRRHPWWWARTRLTLALLDRLGIRPPARVLDAGCGWGVTLESLERAGYQAIGLDVSRSMLERLDRPGRALIEADLAQPVPAAFEPCDAVLALDVIEHLDDDRAAVERLGRLVRPGGLLVLSVPARPEIYTEFDAIQGHRRRYLPETLSAVFAGSGLQVESIFWWGQWLGPVLQRQRRRVRSQPGEPASATYRRYLRLPPWPIPWGLRLAFALEHQRTLDRKLSTGTSLFALARRGC
ncbi:MAG TPA: class I SAM-dependent methyltransferase [Isosphaeraceae bacterium]|nr:class I SAM-dependent methyltransferase [Isosphaeraceae bacterium]